MITSDVYLFLVKEWHVGYDPWLEKEIEDTLKRIEDGTYEYVGEIKPIVKAREIHDGW